jgi:hypothetical protein
MANDLFNLRGRKKLYSAGEAIQRLDTALEINAELTGEDASNISNELMVMLNEALKKVYPDGILAGEANLHIQKFYPIALRYLLNSAFATELQKLIHTVREDIDVHAMLDSSPLDDTRAEVITEHLIQTKYANNKHLNNDIRGYSYAMYIVNNVYRGFPIYSAKSIEAVLDFFAAINDKPDMALWSVRERQTVVSPQASFLSLIGVMIKIEELLDNLEALRPRFDKALKLYLERFK